MTVNQGLIMLGEGKIEEIRVELSLGPICFSKIRRCKSLDCGEPIQIEICDGNLLKADPEGLIGYVALPLAKWGQDPGYA
ncbi:MAG: hypothetical protein MUO68_14405 [Desulfobacteraceae bacterium]|nr:hypothetical protein [Desulfobacteraceae bacterium]